MKTIALILSLVCGAMALHPNGVAHYLTETVNAAQVSETSTHFLHQWKIPRTGDVLASCTSGSNVAVYNQVDSLRYPRWVVYTIDTLYIYADGPKSTSTSTVMTVGFGLKLAEVNASATFTNCGITNFWGFNELSGTTVADYANGLALTVGGGSTLGSAGIFHNGLTGWANGYAGISNAVMSGKTAFTHSMVINAQDYANTVVVSAREGSAIRYHVSAAAGSMNVVIGSNTSYGVIQLSDISAGSPQFFTIVYDGAQATNATKLKVFVNGVAKTVTFTGTIPTSIPTYSLSPIFDMGGYRGGNYYVKGMFDESCLMSAATSDANEMDRYRTLFTSTFYTMSAVKSTSFSSMKVDRWKAYRDAFKPGFK